MSDTVFNAHDEFFMRYALMLAHDAANANEVPVGAIIVADGEIIGKGFNQPITNHDPSAHAEVIALRSAATYLNNYRLVNTTLYVTLEPCLMCVGALVHARINRLVFGAFDEKRGAVMSKLQALDFHFHNHSVNYQGGLLSHECGKVLSNFFQMRRKKSQLSQMIA